MSNEQNQGIGDLVFAVVTDGAAPPVITTSIGVNAQTATPAGVVRNGAGDYTVNHPLAPCDMLSRVNMVVSTETLKAATINSGTDTTTGVLTVTATTGAAVNCGFALHAIRIRD